MDTPIEMAVNLTEQERKEAAKLYPGPTEFVHLHNHTLFSPLDGIATPNEYFSACSELGHPAFSITDHGSIANVPDAYWSSKKQNVKFIVGCEIYFSQEYLEFKELREDPDFKLKTLRPDYSKNTFGVEDLEAEERHSDFRKFRHLSVLAKDMLGYRNLINLTTEAWEIGFYYKPRIWFEQIKKYHEGLIILSGCLNGPVCHNLRRASFWGDVAKKKILYVDRFFNKKKKRIDLSITKEEAAVRQKYYFGEAVNWINKFRNLLGDRFYLELQMPGDEIPFGKEAFKQVAYLSRKLNVPAVLTNDCLELDFPILMSDGTFKPIGEVQIGEYVITHTGKSKKVVAKEIRPRRPNEKMMKISHIPWSMTENHPLYLFESRDDSRARHKPSYCRLGKINLSSRDFKLIDTKKYVVPKRGTKLVDSNDVTVFNSPKQIWRTASPKSKDIMVPRYLKLDDDLLWIIGQYIAEGFKDKYRINFAVNKHRTDTINRIMSYFRKFGLNPDYDESRTNSENDGVIRVCSTIFADLFSSLCGKLAHNKHLPDFWMKLSPRQAKILLSGYLLEDEDRIVGKHGQSFHWTSTSWQLTGQLQVLIASLGGYAKPYFKSQLSTSQMYDSGKMTAPISWESAKNVDLVCDIEVEDDHTFVLWGNVLSRNCHYLSRPDFKVQKCLMAIDQGLTIDDPNLFHVNSDEQFFKSRAQLRKTFLENGYNQYATIEEFEQYCDNTIALSEKCSGFDPDLSPKLPQIPHADSKLTKLVINGLKEKGLYDNPKKFLVDGKEVTYREQAIIELKRYISKGFASYFLIIRDLLNHSKVKGWDVGPGRGSAGGSLVCYLIGIHQLDPMKWGLSSVRFMGDSRGGKMLRVKME